MQDWLTERTWVNSPENIQADDFKTKYGYWNWEKLDQLPALNIMILSERGTGKTFGLVAWALMHDLNLAFLVNSGNNADSQLEKLLHKLKGEGDSKETQANYSIEDKEIHKFFEGWSMDGSYLLDPKGIRRVVSAGINTYYSTKGVRDFMPDEIIYDEFNQQSKLVEQKETKAKDKLDFITGTLRDKQHEPRHVWYFANTNSPDGPIQSCSILTDLGITSLSYLNQFTEVYNTFDLSHYEGLEDTPDYKFLKEQKILNTILIKPEYTREEQLKHLVEMVKNKEQNKFNLDLALTGNASAVLFNEDTFNYDDFVLNTFRLQLSNYLTHYGYLACKNGDILEFFKWNNYKSGYTRRFKYHIKRISKLPDKSIAFCFKKPYKEEYRLMSIVDRNDLLQAFTHGWTSYEDTTSRVDFAREIV